MADLIAEYFAVLITSQGDILSSDILRKLGESGPEHHGSEASFFPEA